MRSACAAVSALVAVKTIRRTAFQLGIAVDFRDVAMCRCLAGDFRLAIGSFGEGFWFARQSIQLQVRIF